MQPLLAQLPAVSVVVPCFNAERYIAVTLSAIQAQLPAGSEIIVIDDGSTDSSAARVRAEFTDVRLITRPNAGVAAARNAGIAAATRDWIAFCDADDVWLPGKLAAQVQALDGEAEAEFASTSILVAFGATQSVRLAGRDRVTHADLLRSRLAMLHSSTFLARRQALTTGIGLLDETIPGSMCEDWDLLLRASARQPIVHVDRPLVRVQWAQTSFFARRWETKLAAHQWMLAHHPAIRTSRVGVSRLFGQIAFDNAALGRRRESVRYALRALLRNPREHRAVLALLVAARIVTAGAVLDRLHRHGRGI